VKVRHVSAETRRTGPVRSLVSRTSTSRRIVSATVLPVRVLAPSIQSPPSLSLW